MKKIKIRNLPSMEVEMGKTYTGLGYSGESDGVTVTGVLTHVDKKFNSATLKDIEGQPHTVIPTTLKETIYQETYY